MKEIRIYAAVGIKPMKLIMYYIKNMMWFNVLHSNVM
jgi:hypothetical protein